MKGLRFNRRGWVMTIPSLLVVSIIVVFFQNCSFNSAQIKIKSLQLDGFNTATYNCGAYGNGTTWFEDTNEVITEEQPCQYGGDLKYLFKQQEELKCENGKSVKTGTMRKGSFISSSGSCVVMSVCGDAAHGSIVQNIGGTWSESKTCQDTTVTVQSVYQKIVNYSCSNGQLAELDAFKGDYISDSESCPQPSLAASFSNNQIHLGETVDLVISYRAITTISYDCSDGQTGTIGVNTLTNNTPIQISKTLTIGVLSPNLSCSVSATTSSGTSLTATAKDLQVICPQDQVQTTDGSSCVPFTGNQLVDSNPSSVDSNPPSGDSNTSSVDSNPPSVDSNTSSGESNASSGDSNASPVDSNPPQVELNASSGDSNPPPADSNTSSGDSNTSSGDSNTSSVDSNPPPVDSNTSLEISEPAKY